LRVRTALGARVAAPLPGLSVPLRRAPLRQHQFPRGSRAVNHPVGIPFAEAREIVARVGTARRVAHETVPLARALGRVLAEPLCAPTALPRFDNSAMDGYAVRASDLASDGSGRLRLVASQFAGRDLRHFAPPGACVRITTGAPLPEWADTVVIKENTRLDG